MYKKKKILVIIPARKGSKGLKNKHLLPLGNKKLIEWVINSARKVNLIDKILLTTEVIIILKGILRVDFYNNKEKYLFSKKLYSNDLIMLSNGGHGFKVLKDIQMIEVKQGPYSLSMDKVKFEKVNENKIKIK